MIIFKQAENLANYISEQKSTGKKIGFVPTMGALHNGHLSLIRASKKCNDLTVCSIFVNPTQFNNPDDLKSYPVSTATDIEQLLSAGCDLLFLPSVEEMYPKKAEVKIYDLGAIEKVLEGKFRPGHFQGVCQAVDRLLEIVNPDHLYLGHKDYQQCLIVKKLLQITGRESTVHLDIVPTVRETDGLAMSSRNLRLDVAQRQLATSISQELTSIKENLHRYPLDELKTSAAEHLAQNGFQVDYVEIANAHDLSPAENTAGKLVALAAACIGKVRLIDNLALN